MLNVVCTLWVGLKLVNASLLVSLGVRQSFAKCMSSQLKHFNMDFDLCRCPLHSTVLCGLVLCI